jgi:hypothetical protein
MCRPSVESTDTAPSTTRRSSTSSLAAAIRQSLSPSPSPAPSRKNSLASIGNSFLKRTSSTKQHDLVEQTSVRCIANLSTSRQHFLFTNDVGRCPAILSTHMWDESIGLKGKCCVAGMV